MSARNAQEVLATLADIEARARAMPLDVGAPEEQTDERVFVGFTVCNMQMVTLLHDLKEIIYVPAAITRVLRVQPWMIGVANVRGSLLPIVDLQRFLCDTDQPVSGDTRILVVERGGLLVGLQVPAVHGLRHLPTDELQPGAGAVAMPLGEFVTGTCNTGGEAWSVFSIDALVQNPKFRVASL